MLALKCFSVFICFAQLWYCGSGDGIPENEEPAVIFYQKILSLEKKVKDRMKQFRDELIRRMYAYNEQNKNQTGTLNISEPCMNSGKYLLQGLMEIKQWAFEMLDAGGFKTNGASLTGALSSFGSYTECLDVVIPESSLYKKQHTTPSTGKYCLIENQLPLPPIPKPYQKVFTDINATFTTEVWNFIADRIYVFYEGGRMNGVCIPSDCTKEDVKEIFKRIIGASGMEMSVLSCEVKETRTPNRLQWIVIVLAIVIVSISLLFSFLDELELYHSSGLDINQPVNGDPIFVKEKFQDIWFQPVANGFLSVVSFVLISGILLAYGVVKIYETRRTYNPAWIVIRRIWRLLPGVLLILGTMFISPLLGKGPMYKLVVNRYYERCVSTWWSNVLFFGNFIQNDQRCLEHLWYVSVDVQLLIVAIPYFFLLFKNELAGKIYLLACTAASIISSGLITYLKNFPPTLIITKTLTSIGLDEYMEKFFTLPNIYLGAFAVGLYFGTFIVRSPNPPKISTKITTLGWLAATVLGTAIVYGVHPWNNGQLYSLLDVLSYSAFHRTAWSLCVAWLVFACYASKGGIIGKFLSWRGFQPIIKPSYLVYLFHPLIISYYDLTQEGSIDANHLQMIYIYCGVLCFSHTFAVFAHILFEAPIMNLDRTFFKWMRIEREPLPSSQTTNHETTPTENKLSNGLKEKETNDQPC